MKKTFTLSAVLAASVAFAQAPVSNPVIHAESAQPSVILKPGEYVPNQLLLMLQPDAVAGALEEKFAAQGFAVAASKNNSKSMRVWTFTFADGTDLEAALKIARTLPEIRLAQFNHYVANRVTVPNDSQFGTMWDMDNTGQSGGTPDADIDAPEAWDITTGGLTAMGDTIVVAVIDAGFDLNHQDLVYWKNYAEIPSNGIDDDGNGYVDDFNGWNAYNSNGNISSDAHGTHITGTIGARGNNSMGVTGINWGLKVMPVMGSTGTESIAVEAYGYVFDARRLYNQTNGAQGAFVVSTNSSFGVDQGQPSAFPIWCAMYDSLGAEGILSAAATANQNWDIDATGDIPTACTSDFMVAVTNMTRNDLRNSGAAFGAITIDIGAPGTSITSTYPSNQYGQMTGTSMATPHIAGAIALMYSAACTKLIMDYKANPDSIAIVVRNYLYGSVDLIPSLSGMCTSGGRLNLNDALLAIQTYNCTPTSVPEMNETITGIFPNPANETVQVTFNTNAASPATVVISDMTGRQVMSEQRSAVAGVNQHSIDVSGLAAGVYLVRVDCGENGGKAVRLIVQ
jgi:serine protease